MLLLSGGVLCTDLLTIDTLDGEALKRCKTRDPYVSDAVSMGVKYYEIHKSRTLSSSLARNSTNAACTSWSTVRPIAMVEREMVKVYKATRERK